MLTTSFGHGDVLIWFIEIFFFVVWFWLLMSIVSDLFRDEEASGVTKALWVVLVLFFPVLGVLAYLILRGGATGPNYDADSVAAASRLLEAKNLPARVMVDCSHANSEKDHRRQADVAANVAGQVAAGSDAIFGLMLESFLVEGRQDHSQSAPDKASLVRGQSITDACLSWDQTVPVFDQLADAVRKRRG